MDRTHPCGGCNVGSIPAGGTRSAKKETTLVVSFFVYYSAPSGVPAHTACRNRTPEHVAHGDSEAGSTGARLGRTGDR